MKSWKPFLQVRNKIRIPTLSTSIWYSIERSYHSHSRRKRRKGIHFGSEEVKQLQFAKTTIPYTENPKVLTKMLVIVVVQSLSHVQLSVTPWTASLKASLSFTIFWSLLKFMSIESVIPTDYLMLCCPFPLLPSIFPSIKVFSVSKLFIRWPKYWSFSFSISPFNEHSGLIFFRIDRFELLAVQGTLKSLLQHHSLKASSLECVAFFMVQLSPPYVATGEKKNTKTFYYTFVGKVIFFFLIHCLNLS